MRGKHSESVRSALVSDTRRVIDALIPYAHVADVRRSLEFYERLGLRAVNTYAQDGQLLWAFVANDAGARLMLARAEERVEPAAQAVLWYVWAPDVLGLREELASAGVAVGEVEHPFYMPAGEFRVEDPDGYVLLIGQLGDGAAP